MIEIQYTSGLTVSITVTASPGTGESWVAGDPVISWGDGTTTGSVLNGRAYSHTYPSYGTYTIGLEGENTCGKTAGDEESITLVSESRLPPCFAPDGLGYGDVDGDGYVTNDDVQLVSDYTVGNITLTDAQLIRADVNNDGDVTMTDARLINKYVAGTIDTFSVCECPTPTASFPNTPEISFDGTTATCRIYVNAGAGETPAAGTSIMGFDGTNWVQLATQLNLSLSEQTVDLTWEMTADTDYCYVDAHITNSCSNTCHETTAYYSYSECPDPTCSFTIN